MTFYHDKKEDAIAAGGDLLGSDWEVRAELEPYNGWVIVGSPLSVGALMSVIDILPALLESAELDLSSTPRLRTRPATHREPPKVAPKISSPRSSSRVSGDEVVTVLTEKNPKRAGSKSAERYEHYETGITVDEFVRRGGTVADVLHDQGKNFIKLGFSESAS